MSTERWRNLAESTGPGAVGSVRRSEMYEHGRTTDFSSCKGRGQREWSSLYSLAVKETAIRMKPVGDPEMQPGAL